MPTYDCHVCVAHGVRLKRSLFPIVMPVLGDRKCHRWTRYQQPNNDHPSASNHNV